MEPCGDSGENPGCCGDGGDVSPKSPVRRPAGCGPGSACGATGSLAETPKSPGTCGSKGSKECGAFAAANFRSPEQETHDDGDEGFDWNCVSFRAKDVIRILSEVCSADSGDIVEALDLLRQCYVILPESGERALNTTGALRVSYDASNWCLDLGKAAEILTMRKNDLRNSLPMPRMAWGVGRLPGLLERARRLRHDAIPFLYKIEVPEFEGVKEAIHLEYYGYKIEAIITVEKFELKAIIASSPSRVIVSFRGTDNNANMMLDINLCPGAFKPHEGWNSLIGGVKKVGRTAKRCFCCGNSSRPSDGKTTSGFAKVHRSLFGDQPEVHLGFLQAWQSLEPAVLYAVSNICPVDDPRPIFFTGHSLGGALSQIGAYHVTWKLYQFRKKVKVYAFACPRVGNFNFKNCYEAVVPETFRVNMNGDPLTNVPPSCGRARYFHAGTEFHLGRHDAASWSVDPTWLDSGAIPMPRPHSHLLGELKKALNRIVLRFNPVADSFNKALLPSGEDDTELISINDRVSREKSGYIWPWVRISRPDVSELNTTSGSDLSVVVQQ
eukprot:TRINITY_DN37461_c0_g1_i1.p1 TRINITY_DN37461_c0_g1~~TRINITY_DN37461_c0_g1_i1.p1  ORF type:complete len:582 (+),score=189.11 TRINITY_DN37461_c0_g1_i1:89-1747(+)